MTPTATREPTIVVWRGEYYDNPDLVGAPLLVRNDMEVNFNWGPSAPAADLPADGFSARWTRTLSFVEGSYRFNARGDDGVRVWLDGELIIDQWHLAPATDITYSAERTLSASQHTLRIEYFERQDVAQIHVWWERVGDFPQWRGEYFPDVSLSGVPALVRNDPNIDFNWGRNAPAAGLPAESFSARWTRKLAFEGGLYRFQALVDDGMRLYVDGDLVLDEWRDGASREVTAERNLSAGDHALRVEYYERTGDAVIHVGWEKLTTYPDWKGEYWSNRQLSDTPVLVRNDPLLDFAWGTGAPAFGLPADNFSVRWTRKAEFAGATYRFHILVDDGARLWVDDQLIIDAWYDSSLHEVTTEYALVQGVHSLRVEYYDHTHEARIRVWWEKIAVPTYPDWKGEYWPSRYLSRFPTLVRNDPAIDFNWGREAPAIGLPADNFSVRWTRQVTFSPGVYRFYAWSDDGIRLYVDDDLVLDEWHDNIADDVYVVDLTLGGLHDLVVEYYEEIKEARVKLWWKMVSALPTPTPTMTLVPRYTPTMTPRPTNTPTPTDTPPITPAPTDTPTQAPTATLTATPQPTDTSTRTPVPTDTPTLTVTSTPTPEPVPPTPTTSATLSPSPTSTPMPLPPGVRFSEVLPNSGEVDWDGDGTANELDEWIEIYNPGPATVDISNWYLDDVLGGNQLYRIPPRTVLLPRQFIVFYRAKTGIALADDGAMVRLLNTRRSVADVAIIPPLDTDASTSRDETGVWHDDWPPSPGAPNRPPGG